MFRQLNPTLMTLPWLQYIVWKFRIFICANMHDIPTLVTIYILEISQKKEEKRVSVVIIFANLIMIFFGRFVFAIFKLSTRF